MFLDSDDYIDKALLKTLEQYINKDIDLIKFKLQRVRRNKNAFKRFNEV